MMGFMGCFCYGIGLNGIICTNFNCVLGVIFSLVQVVLNF
jgi:hypothetical protein